MRLEKIKKIHDGKYLKNYELTYFNKAGREKKYEIVSRRELSGVEDLGQKTSGVSIIAWKEDNLLLLREYRMAVNKEIYNLCAGMIEEGETMEDCIRRELYEETGLSVSRIHTVLPPSFAAVGISDIRTNLAFVEVEGEIADHTSENESIKAAFYTREQIRDMLVSEEFSSRSQLAAYAFLQGNFV